MGVAVRRQGGKSGLYQTQLPETSGRGANALENALVLESDGHGLGIKRDDTSGITAEVTHGQERSGVERRDNVNATWVGWVNRVRLRG